MPCVQHSLERKKQDDCSLAVKPQCLNHVATKGENKFGLKLLTRDCSWKQCRAKSIRIQQVCICVHSVGKQVVRHYKR